MKVLSLYDGMACGALALQAAGIDIESYDAFEIDKYAAQTSAHNFPFLKQHGDVFEADFTQFKGVDLVCGGSPCTYWSIAQKNNRETEASGMGWELFQQYARAIREAEPKFFVYENNKSMSKQIKASIDEAFGFESVLINSALVSAQNRQRLYWVGKRNADGTYTKVDIEQPKDKGITLKDILESGEDLSSNEKSYALTTRCSGAIPEDTIRRRRHTMAAEPVACRCRGRINSNGCGYAKYECRTDGKVNTLDTNTTNGAMVAEPVCVAERGRYTDSGKRSQKGNGPVEQFYEAREDGKTNALTTVQKDNAVAESVRIGALPKGIHTSNETIENAIPEIVKKRGYVPEMFNAYNRAEITDKAPTLSTGSMVTSSCAVNILEEISYAIPVEFVDGIPTKAISATDGKVYPVYEVRNGLITVKGKQYPIKLKAGYYIIRKLTVRECMRLQTVPDWFEFPVSNTQAYKMLGNGWTVDVIAHIFTQLKKAEQWG